MQGIHRQLARARRRLALRGALTGAVVATPPAAALGLVAGATPAIGVLAAAVALGASRRRDPEAIARQLDRHAQLSDRLGNAVAFTRDGRSGGFAALAIADGERHAHLADPDAAFPIRAPHATGYAIAGVLVVAAIALVPRPDVALSLAVVPPITPPGTADPSPRLSDGDIGFVHRLIAQRRAATQDPALRLALDDIDSSLSSLSKVSLLSRLSRLADTFPALADITTAIRHSRPAGSADSSLPTSQPPNLPTSQPQGLRATVESAARHGFAGVTYKNVYADYASIVEDVMRTERVPPGHRYLVERYFDTIRPQESEIPGRPGASNGNAIIDVPDVTPPGHR